jgi:hypothetical protein
MQLDTAPVTYTIFSFTIKTKVMSEQKQLTVEQITSLSADARKLVDQHDELLGELRMQEIFVPPLEAGEEVNIMWLKEHLRTGRKIESIRKQLHELDPEKFMTPEAFSIETEDPIAQGYLNTAMQQLAEEEKEVA